MKHLVAFALAITFCAASALAEKWTLVLPDTPANDAAITAAVEDLQSDGAPLGIQFSIGDMNDAEDNVIVVGASSRNAHTKTLTADGRGSLSGVESEQGFEIRPLQRARGRGMVVSGGSLIGEVYGLYWIWDRMRVFKEIPELDLKREPRLTVRLTEAPDKAALRNALRATATWVADAPILDIVPWDAEPEARKNAATRKDVQQMIDAAHAFHMKYLGICDEISFHPCLQEEFGFKLDPADPALWAALQAKYRRLFQAMPDLDGVRIRTGELTRVGGNYIAYDVMHEPENHPWSLEQRYRTFVQKMHEVVVGEFDKIYFHRTWATTSDEQHSNADVYKSIFTSDVPTKNLYLSPYMSLADRWYYQPYNPTFNQTPHQMVVLLSVLDYHASGTVNVFPSWPGDYHQGGVRSVLANEHSNLTGVHFGAHGGFGWNTWGLTAYLAFRLAWDPEEDQRTIAHDFAAIHLGTEAADGLADIILLSQVAYKDGIYVKPVAEAIRGNTLPHLRLTTFQLMGLPDIDRGRTHLDWLQRVMYAPSKGHTSEAMALLDRGLEAAREMEARFVPLADKTTNPALAAQVADSLCLTRLLVETNRLYVKTIYAYFEYREARDEPAKARLARDLAALQDAMRRFSQAPGFDYKLYGIEALVTCAADALTGLEAAEARLAEAPTEEEAYQLIAGQQAAHAQAISKYAGESTHFLHWRGRVDGKDILHIKGEELKTEHVAYDELQDISCEFKAPLPRKEVTVLLQENEALEIHPFVLEQPSAANDYTVRVYLYNRPPGYAWWDFDLYFVDKPPESLGLETPW